MPYNYWLLKGIAMPNLSSITSMPSTPQYLQIKNSNVAPVAEKNREENKLSPKILNFKFADIPVADKNHEIVKALFAPDSLTPSKKPENITTHFSKDDWVYLLVSLNAESQQLDHPNEIVSKFKEKLGSRITAIEEKVQSVSAEIARLKNDSARIKTANRNYKTGKRSKDIEEK